MKPKEDIKEYWEQRAQENAGSTQATTNDIYLRELEMSAIAKAIESLNLPARSTVLDVGCGDGYTTLKVAEVFPELRFVGIDYSQKMILNAERRLAGKSSDVSARVKFRVGDATGLAAACGEQTFDLAMTDRCLINLPSFETQRKAIAEIAKHVRPGGHYLAIENFLEGQNAMNEMRRSIGLPEIPIRWHNLFFREAEFIEAVVPFFENITFNEFSSSYYFATRVVYSGMCQMRGMTPDYTHEIHKLAVNLPPAGLFSPIRMVLMTHRR